MSTKIRYDDDNSSTCLKCNVDENMGSKCFPIQNYSIKSGQEPKQNKKGRETYISKVPVSYINEWKLKIPKIRNGQGRGAAKAAIEL